MNKKDRCIFQTDEYEKFHDLYGNRDLTELRVRKIMESIQAIGYICSPIIVNEKYEVIDGQGRLESAKRMNLPVYYIVVSGIGIKECQSMNINQGNWKLKDFIYSYSKTGNINYQYLEQLMKEYSGRLTDNILERIALGTYYGGLGGQDLIKKGLLTFGEQDYIQARKLCDWLIPFVPLFKRINSLDMYIGAMRFIHDHVDCDLDKLGDKIIKNQIELIPVKRIDQALEVIEKIYNVRNRNPVFMKVEYQKKTSERARENFKKRRT